MGTDRKWLTESLRQSLEALALPGERALALMRSGTVRADELALGYDHYFTAYRSNFGAELNASQLLALGTVHELLGDMSGHINAILWTEQAVISHQRWAEVRNAAKHAIREMGWLVPVA
jgi:hypothetical protein